MNIVQQYRMANVDDRISVIGEFVEKSLLGFIASGGNNGHIHLFNINKVAEQFINRPVMIQEDPQIQWFLPREWFKSILAQCLKGVNDKQTKQFYRELKWDYKRAIKPKGGDGVTLQYFDFSSIIEGANDMVLRLVSRDAYPVDTMLISSSGAEWVVLGKSGSKYELEHKSGLINFKSSARIYQNYTVR